MTIRVICVLKKSEHLPEFAHTFRKVSIITEFFP